MRSLRWGLKEREVTMRFSLSGWEDITTQNTNLQQWKFKNCTKICDFLKIYQQSLFLKYLTLHEFSLENQNLYKF